LLSRIGGAFTGGFKGAYGDDSDVITPAGKQALQNIGVLPPDGGGTAIQRFFNAPLVEAGSMALRAMPAAYTGVQDAAREALTGVGLDDRTANDLVAMPDAFMGSPGELHGAGALVKDSAIGAVRAVAEPFAQAKTNASAAAAFKDWLDEHSAPPPAGLALPAPDGLPMQRDMTRQEVFDAQRATGMPTEVPASPPSAPSGIPVQVGEAGNAFTDRQLLPAPPAPEAVPTPALTRQQVFEAQQRLGLPSEVTSEAPPDSRAPMAAGPDGTVTPGDRLLPAPDANQPPAPMLDDAITRARAQMEGGNNPGMEAARTFQGPLPDQSGASIPLPAPAAEAVPVESPPEPPKVAEPPPAPTPPAASVEAPKPVPDDAAPAPQLSDTWTAARTEAANRVAELRGDIDRMETARDARNAGQSPPELAQYRTPGRVDQAIRAKYQALGAAEGRQKVAEGNLQDIAEGRQPVMDPRYPAATDNRALGNPKPQPPGGIIDAIRRAGGIKNDAGGELRARDLHLTPGLVNNKSKFTLQTMGERLANEGYMDDLHNDLYSKGVAQRSAENDLLEAIDQEKSGRPVYTAEDQEAHQNALAAHEDKADAIEQVRQSLGLDREQVRGLTEGQFQAKLRDLRSQDELAAAATAHDDKMDVTHEEVLRDYDQHLADNARPWEPSDADYASPGARGDNDNAHPADDGQQAGQRSPGSGEPGGANRPPGSGGPNDTARPAEQGAGAAGAVPGVEDASRGSGPAVDRIEGAGTAPATDLARPGADTVSGHGSGDFKLQPGSERPASGRAPASRQRALEAEGQGVLAGAEGSDRQAIQAREEAPNRGSVPQKGMADFSLFDPEARNQLPLTPDEFNSHLDKVFANDKAKGEPAPLIDQGAAAARMPNKLFSGPTAIFDPDTWKFMFGPITDSVLKPFADSFKDFRDAMKGTTSINRERMERVPQGDHPEAKIPGAAGRFVRQAGAFSRMVFYGDDSAMRAMADRLPTDAKEASHAFLDKFFARAGEARGAGKTFQEGLDTRFNSSINRLSDTLGKFVKTPDQMAQIVRLVQNPANIRRGNAMGEAAFGLKGWLAEHLAYMKKNGLDVGTVSNGYFPRRLDTDAVWRDMPGFEKAARDTYKAAGMNPADAAKAASSWVDNIRLNGADSRSPMKYSADGFAADHVSGRELPKSADQTLSKFLVKDPLQVLVGYSKSAAERAEYARVMGMETAKDGTVSYRAWNDLLDGLRAGKAEAIAPRFEDYVRNAVGQNSAGVSRGVTKSLSWLRAIGTLGLMGHATMTSLSEVFTAGARTGELADIWHQTKGMTAYWFKNAIKTEGAERMTALAQDVGTIVNHLGGSFAAARWTGGDLAAGLQLHVLGRFFQAIGLEQWSHGMNVAATGVGDTFLRRLAGDMADSNPRIATRAGVNLAELGVGKDQAAKFGTWLRGAAPDGMTTDILAKAPKDVADAYRTALFRFTRQVHMQPTAATKPRWASNPFGAMAFHLSGYAYAVHTNVLMRAVRLAQNGDLNGAEKMGMAAKMWMGLLAAVPAQMAIGAARSTLFDSKQSAQAYQENKTATAVSRSGILGAVDPWFQLLSGLRYHKDLGTSIAGPAGGRLLSAAQAGASIMQGETSTPSGSRKTMQALYDAGLQPAANFAATALPLPIAAAVAQLVGSGRVREAFTSATAGPPSAHPRHHN
jgi:hypothetical protein